MTNQFISPNWHVLFIHYPIAFLSFGIIVELLSFLWPRGYFRAAGRWMILLGALLTLPALTAGLYAFRQTAGPSAAQPALIPWYEVVRGSSWTAEQWRFMCFHILLNSIGVAVVVLAVTAWVACSDFWRRRLYWPVLAALICGMGLLSVGAWFGGESVYRYGTGVGIPPAHGAPSILASAPPHQGHEESEAHERPARGIKFFIPPLELHIVLAGITVAIALGALGLTFRRLERPEEQMEPGETIRPEEPPGTGVPPDQITMQEGESMPHQPYAESAPLIFPARFWLLACLAGLSTAVTGLWSVIGIFTADRLSRNGHMLAQSDHRRLLLHVIFGVILVLLTLVLAGLARFGRQRRTATGAFSILAVLVIALQLWLGLAMLYDGHEGPVLGFNSPSSSH